MQEGTDTETEGMISKIKKKIVKQKSLHDRKMKYHNSSKLELKHRKALLAVWKNTDKSLELLE